MTIWNQRSLFTVHLVQLFRQGFKHFAYPDIQGMGQRVQRGQSGLLFSRFQVLNAPKGTAGARGDSRLGKPPHPAFFFQHVPKWFREGSLVHRTETYL